MVSSCSALLRRRGSSSDATPPLEPAEPLAETTESTNPQAEWETKLAEALALAEKHKDDWLRAKAETENIRRRAAELDAEPQRVRDALADGARTARAIAQTTMHEVRERMGLGALEIPS